MSVDHSRDTTGTVTLMVQGIVPTKIHVFQQGKVLKKSYPRGLI